MEKKQEIEKRLEDVKGQLGNSVPPKKTPKKGIISVCVIAKATVRRIDTRSVQGWAPCVSISRSCAQPARTTDTQEHWNKRVFSHAARSAMTVTVCVWGGGTFGNLEKPEW